MKKSVAPYLSVRDGDAAIAFYKTAFGAEELERFDYEGKLGHATLRINDHVLMLADELPEMEDMTGNVAPPTLGGRTTFTINLTVDDADKWFDRAIKAGATAIRPVTDEFFGRHGKLRDPFGHVWSVVTLNRERQS
ncbi:VOC family protein [Hyphobacterium indicum]|uniref:VOC family protein n=1 Tax=Hyphobacterium indicum TaxID=2162714 RepID=UPI000D64139D|nr:VOC family protein [Hyphobacterium indicum]